MSLSETAISNSSATITPIGPGRSSANFREFIQTRAVSTILPKLMLTNPAGSMMSDSIPPTKASTPHSHPKSPLSAFAPYRKTTKTSTTTQRHHLIIFPRQLYRPTLLRHQHLLHHLTHHPCLHSKNAILSDLSTHALHPCRSQLWFQPNHLSPILTPTQPSAASHPSSMTRNHLTLEPPLLPLSTPMHHPTSTSMLSNAGGSPAPAPRLDPVTRLATPPGHQAPMRS